MPKISKKKAKILAKLRNFGIPLGWEEALRLLKDSGFKEQPSGRGSPRAFTKGSVRLVLHEPHGRGYPNISKRGRAEIINALERAEAEEKLKQGEAEE